jgi:hypothetical protein
MLVLLPLLLLAVASSPAPTTAGDGGGAVPVGNIFSFFCSPTNSSVLRTYQPNSTFAGNLQKLVSELPSNASAASGFAAGRFGAGAGPGAAYGTALCRGDFLGGQCADCLAEGFSQAASRCPGSVDATMYYDQCQLRFSDQDFLLAAASANNMPESTAWNMNRVSAGNVAAFDALVKGLVAAASDAASDRSSRYATGQAGFPPESINVYALVQCAQDLTARRCRECLAGLMGQMGNFFAGRVGGRILGVRCVIRYEKDVFFAQTPDMLTVAPLLGSTSTKG